MEIRCDHEGVLDVSDDFKGEYLISVNGDEYYLNALLVFRNVLLASFLDRGLYDSILEELDTFERRCDGYPGRGDFRTSYGGTQ